MLSTSNKKELFEGLSLRTDRRDPFNEGVIEESSKSDAQRWLQPEDDDEIKDVLVEDIFEDYGSSTETDHLIDFDNDEPNPDKDTEIAKHSLPPKMHFPSPEHIAGNGMPISG